MAKIKSITAREILSSSGLPTLEVEVELKNGVTGRASVPYGVSAGKKEAKTLFDNDKKRYGGKGMLLAAKSVNEKIAAAVVGKNPLKQKEIDELMIRLDGTANKSKLGGNSILVVSLAVARAGAALKKMELFSYLRWLYKINKSLQLPKPMIVLIEGGKHAFQSADFQEYLVVPKFRKACDNVRVGVEVYQSLKKILEKQKIQTTVGNEGAFAPPNLGNEAPWQLILEAIKLAGYNAGKQLALAADLAASEIYKKGKYILTREAKCIDAEQLAGYFKEWLAKYPIFSLEDPFSEIDWSAWAKSRAYFGSKILVIADDLTVTNKELLKKCLELKAANGIIIKPNQVGTLSETVSTILFAQDNGFKTIVSHRGGGETNDTFIVDLAVAFGCDFLKVGISRGERVSKYNRLLEIEEKINR